MPARRLPSPWNFTDLPEGRSRRDLPHFGGPGAGDPRGVWLFEKSFPDVLAIAIGMSVAIVVPIACLAAAYPAVVLVFAASVVVGLLLWARVRDPDGFHFQQASGLFYLPLPAIRRADAEARVEGALRSCGQSISEKWPSVAHTTWHLSRRMRLSLISVPLAYAESTPPAERAPNSLSLQTKGSDNLELHRRLKGQLQSAFAPEAGPGPETFEPLKVAGEVKG